MSEKDEHRIIYAGECIDIKDPLNLGRIRVNPKSENIQEIYSAIKTDCAEYDPTDKSKSRVIGIKQSCKWKQGDPFMFLPLLPFSISIQPKEGEYVHVIYGDKSYKYQNQFYIPGVFSSPMAINYENFNASQTFLASGGRVDETLLLKNELDQYYDTRSEGIFPTPEDNALLGRGSADVIVKENEVLLRAGKFSGFLTPSKYPTGYDKRSFLQLSYFKQKKIELPSYSVFNLLKKTQVIKKLIEWNIFNPENNSDKFTGVINLYNVIPDTRTNTENFTVDSDVQDLLSAPIYQVSFFSESYEQVKLKINQFIQGVNTGKINIVLPPIDLDPDPNNVLMFDASDSFNVPEDRFPFVFRPGPITYQNMKNFDGTHYVVEYGNISKFYNNVCLNPADDQKGFGIVYNYGKLTPNYDTKEIKETPSEYTDAPVTYATLGGDKLYLLSHEGNGIPGKGDINLQNTLYGIPQSTFSDELDSKTNSMVRGEQLIDFLNLLTKFLVAHVHPFPGLPPVPVAVDGTQSAQILSELLNAPNKILNQNIRVN
jgi:hypothetical protein